MKKKLDLKELLADHATSVELDDIGKALAQSEIITLAFKGGYLPANCANMLVKLLHVNTVTFAAEIIRLREQLGMETEMSRENVEEYVRGVYNLPSKEEAEGAFETEDGDLATEIKVTEEEEALLQLSNLFGEIDTNEN